MAQKVAIIDYGSGNLRSVEKALERAAQELALDVILCVTDSAGFIGEADRIVLPGVGAFGACMAGLAARPGVMAALEKAVRQNGRPFLGICVGMQLLADRGLEFGEHTGLGWVSGEVLPFPDNEPQFRVPHMGWNEVAINRAHPLLAGLENEAFYFAHSYYFASQSVGSLYAICSHGIEVAAAVGQDNVFGVQFHPEKSQAAGIKLLKNFLLWNPE